MLLLVRVELKGAKKKPPPPTRGPLLVTHRGLSGPAALRLSAFKARELDAVAAACSALELPFDGKDTNKEEFVTAGGVRLKEINFKTYESKSVPGLHFCGELVDVDGVTGGFNFMHCWCSGFAAGTSAAAIAEGVS